MEDICDINESTTPKDVLLRIKKFNAKPNQECFVELLVDKIPEIKEMRDKAKEVWQDRLIHNYPSLHHSKDYFEHTIEALKYIPEDEDLKLAMLFHDIGKVETTECDESGCHSFDHWDVSSEKTKDIMNRLGFPKNKTDKIQRLVHYHHVLLNIDPDTASEKSLRRVVHKYGDILDDLEIIAKADIMSDNPNKEKEVKRINRIMIKLKQLG